MCFTYVISLYMFLIAIVVGLLILIFTKLPIAMLLTLPFGVTMEFSVNVDVTLVIGTIINLSFVVLVVLSIVNNSCCCCVNIVFVSIVIVV